MNSLGGLAAGIGWLLVVVVIGTLLIFVPQQCSQMNNSRANELQAEARLEQARGEARSLIEAAQSDREDQRSTNWRREFELYTVAMMVFTNDHTLAIAVLAGLLGCAVGGVVIRWIERAKIF